MALYASIFYGGGTGGGFYGPSDTDVPIDLRFYRTNTDGVYIFHWGFQSQFVTPALPTYDFDLQLDTVTTFDSPDLVMFDSTTAQAFQNGNVRKGFQVPVNPRIDKIQQTWYARVRTKKGFNFSAWSFFIPFIIPMRFEVQSAEDLINDLPDFHVYNKQDLLLPVNQRKTLLYTIADMYGVEFDQVQLENILTTTNNFIDLCRDEQFYQNFGFLFNYIKPSLQQYVEYRETTRAMILGSLEGGTFDAISRVVRSFSGVDPVIELIRDDNDFFLSTISEAPLDAPDGVRKKFHVSYQFTPNTMIVLKNGVFQASGVDYVEDESLPGFDMTVAPGPSDVLLVFYDIGAATDPDPLIYDPSDTTALTGTFTFTNNSLNITGVGTLFTTELNPGDDITDSQKLIVGKVNMITDNTHLTLTLPWVGNSGSGAGNKERYTDVQLPPTVLWDKATLAYGIIIHVLNPAHFSLPQNVIQGLADQLIPAHVKYFWEFDS